jgi:hypothetical protein
MVRGPRSGSTAGDRRIAKQHSGFAGSSIIELLEEQLTEACTQYLHLKRDSYDSQVGPSKLGEARGRVRGIAISVAMMRHPLRRGEGAWWGYIKKLELRHIKIASSSI